MVDQTRAETRERVTIAPLSGALGAEISGVDLSKPLTDEIFAEIYQAFLDHLVIFFRDQDLGPEELIAIGSRFGELHIHDYTETMEGYPEVIEVIKLPEEKHNWGDGWHIDSPSFECPPLGSVIHAKDVPPYGGDTQWSNMYLAYETLSEGMKRLLAGLECVFEASHKNFMGYAGIPHKEGPARTAAHPVVRTHPVTGKKSLFLGFRQGRQFKDMTVEESAPILDYLYQHLANPDFTCRFHWENGAVGIWDNRCTLHRVQADYFHELRGIPQSLRYMTRVQMMGDRPY